MAPTLLSAVHVQPLRAITSNHDGISDYRGIGILLSGYVR